MPAIPTPTSPSPFPTTSATTMDGVTHIDLNFMSAISRGAGTIFITDGAIQTVIDRVTGQPKLRVVGASFTKEIALDQVRVSGSHVLFDVAGLPANHSWNVYMGAGTLLGAGRPVAAIRVPGSASFTTPEVVIDPPLPPTLSATIALDGGSLKSGEQIAVTITFNKAVEHLDPDSLAAANATLADLASDDGGITWTATLTGQAATDAAGNVLRLNMESVTAADGSHGAGSVTSNAYGVDTLVAAWISPVIEIYGDAGPDDMDGVTNNDRVELGGYLHGALNDGESIELVVNGRTIAADDIGLFPLDGDVYYWYYAVDDAEPFAEGSNSVQVRVVGRDGHSSATSTKTVVVETDAPDIVGAPTGTVDAAGAISIVFNEAMYFQDHSEIVTDIRVVDGLGNTRWITLDRDHFSADGRTLTLQTADHDLATGNSYRFYLPDSLTDLAGNQYMGAPVAFSTAGPYQDKAAPRLLQIYIVNGDGAYGEGQVLELRMRFSEKVELKAGVDLALDLNNGKAATYAGLASGGTEMAFRYTVAAGDDVARLGVYTPWALAGNVHDDAGNLLQNAHIEYDGLTNGGGYGAWVEIDTIVAKPGAPLLHPDSDSGAVGDRNTDVTSPRLTGSGAEPGAEIALYLGDVKIGSAWADDAGLWDTVVTGALPAGTHEIRAVQEDRAGNLSAASDALVLTITAAPTVLAAPVLDAASDSGVSDSDRVTADATPTLRGSGPAGATLTLQHNGADLAEVTTNADGNWSYTTAALDDGVHSFTVRAGSGGAPSPILSITVDGARPAVTASPDGALHLHPDGDLVIGFGEAVEIGAADGDSGMLLLRDGDDNLIRIARDAIGFSVDRKTLTIAAARHAMAADTDYRLTLPATLTDLAGNPIDHVEIAFHTGNDQLPEVARAIVAGTHGGAYDNAHSYREGEVITFRVRFNESIQRVGSEELSLGLSNGARAGFTGIGGAGGNEALFSYTVGAGHDQEGVTIVDSTLAGALADLSGNVLDAAHIAFDGLYDSSGYGSYIDIDTVAPSALAVPVLANDTGLSSTDRVTRDALPVLAGSGAEAHAAIKIMRGDEIVGVGTADEDGVWEAFFGSPLNEGAHTFSVRQLDGAGNAGPESPAFTVTVDTTRPNPPNTPVLDAGSDSGVRGDGITSDHTPTLRGTADPATRVVLYVNEREVGRADTDASGNWSFTLDGDNTLLDGAYSIGLKQFDLAGNLSAFGDSFDLVIEPVLAAALSYGSMRAVRALQQGADGDTGGHVAIVGAPDPSAEPGLAF